MHFMCNDDLLISGFIYSFIFVQFNHVLLYNINTYIIYHLTFIYSIYILQIPLEIFQILDTYTYIELILNKCVLI